MQGTQHFNKKILQWSPSYNVHSLIWKLFVKTKRQKIFFKPLQCQRNTLSEL